MSTQAYTSEQKELHDSLSTVVWDLYKDAHGLKPRWMDFNAMSIEELNALISELQVDLERNEAFEVEIEAEAIKELEKAITDVMDICRCDRFRAIEHLMDAEDDEHLSNCESQDIEHFFWKQDIGIQNAIKYTREYLEFINKKVA